MVSTTRNDGAEPGSGNTRTPHPVPEKRVLLLSNRGTYEAFHRELDLALSALGCVTTSIQNWADARRVLDSGQRFDMVAVDPAVEGFREAEFVGEVVRRKDFRNTPLVLVRACPEDDLYSMEDRLDVDASLCRSFNTYAIAFVVNRILFDGGHQRRLHTRSLTGLSIEFRSSASGGVQQHASLNLSVAGTFIRTPQPEPTGTELALTIHMPDGLGPIRALGRVVYANDFTAGPEAVIYPSGMGVYFEDIPSSARTRIAHHILPRILRVERRATRRSVDL